MRRAFLLAAITISASPAACAFILDFDELQEGSALPSSDASVGDATGDSDCVCTSNDPCRPQECVEGQCVEKPYVGLAYDGYHATFSADQVHRITLAQQRAGAFYGSVFYDDGTPRLKLFKAPFNETLDGGEPSAVQLTSEIASNLPLLAGLPNAVPASAAGLVDAGNGVLASFATTDGSVYHLVLDNNFVPQSMSGLSPGTVARYATANPTRHPQTWVAGGKAYVGWITTSGQIVIPDGATQLTFGNVGVTAFAPLLTPGGAAVVWGEGSGGIFSQHQDDPNPSPLADCPAISGWAPFFVGGFGLVGANVALTIAIWTKTTGGNFAAQARAVTCTTSMCSFVTPNPICPDDVSPGVKTFAALPVQIPEQEAYHQVYAAAVQDAGQAQVVLEAAVVDAQTSDSEPLGPTQVLADSAAQPDLPALAYSGGDKFLVGWVERTTPARAHLKRFRLCTGD